nr:hypothetical protein [Tanacetum cinerariifolium]
MITGLGAQNNMGARQANQFSRLTKVEFPKFYNEDVLGWIFKYDRFFLIDTTPNEEKTEYKEAITLRFGSVHDDPIASPKNAKYDKSAKDYQDTFDNLLCKVEVSKEHTTLEAVKKKSIPFVNQSTSIFGMTGNSGNATKQPLLPKPNTPLSGTPRKQLTQKEKQIEKVEARSRVELIMMSIYPNSGLQLMSMVQAEQTKAMLEPKLQKVIDAYVEVFAIPNKLPPVRSKDHKIPLIPGTPPVNIRPYKHPPMQKDAIEAMECLVCQKCKPDLSAYPGLLHPLPIPKTVLTKYAHFIHMAHPFTALQVARVFLDQVCKLHGVPESIVSDMDKVFLTIDTTLFEALYGQPLPVHVPYVGGLSKVDVVDRSLIAREKALVVLKFHLSRAQHRMDQHAYKHRLKFPAKSQIHDIFHAS